MQARLAALSKILRRPMNRLVNEAVEAYVERRSSEVERDLEASLASLRAYRQRDPNFEQAIADFAEAEVSIEDQVEGQPADDGGPVRTEIDRLLNGGLGRR